jgi:hypothetical protein
MGGLAAPQESSRPMNERDNFRLKIRIFIGMALAALGILFTLDNLGVLDAEDYLRFGWPVGLIAYGTLSLSGRRSGRGRMWGTVALIAGVALMGQRLGLWSAELRAFSPLLLVFLGGYLVWHSMRGDDGGSRRERARQWRSSFEHAAADRGTASQPTIDSGDSISAVAVLAGIERRVTSAAFRGGELTAVLGGGQIDMREAIPAGGEAVIDVFAVMGGLEIRVPDSWSIEVRATPVLGAIRDTRPPASSTGPRLIVRGMVFLGGVEFKS